MSARAARGAFCLVVMTLTAPLAWAAPDGGTQLASVRGCVESIPRGAARPTLEEELPAQGTSGYATRLVVRVSHGKGETLMPSGLSLERESEGTRMLRKEGFAFPDQDGGAAATIEVAERDGTTTSTLTLPIVLLPEKAGRAELVLPPLPISIARASGEVMTLCTRPHAILVEDPTANEPEATPHPNAPPLPQREEWTSLKNALLFAGAATAAGLVAALALRRWRARPKPVPPPAPPRPPWEIAFEDLERIRGERLLDGGRYVEHVDRVTDTLRTYLGARFGFDGLECTTDEVMSELERRLGRGTSYDVMLVEVRALLAEADLAKFARAVPPREECERLIDRAAALVVRTRPAPAPPPGRAAEAPR